MKKYENGKDDEFREAWDSAYSAVPDKEVEESWKEFRLRLKSHKRSNYTKAGLIAASLLVLSATYFFLEIHTPIIVKSNFSQVAKEVNLPDGSIVYLNPGATIRYKEDFLDSRGLELEGGAFFNVVKDSLKEFNVIAGPTLTKVLGTTFSVNTTVGTKDVEVSLYTGRVMVSVENKAHSWGIIPGERFVYKKDSICIRKFNPKLSFETGNEFIDVNNIEVEELLNFLSKRFDYEFIKNTPIKNRQVTLRINKSDSLKQILKILSTINNTTYEINEEAKEIQVRTK